MTTNALDAPPANPPRLPPPGADLSWERMPNESSKAYEAFLEYCKLGPARTLTEVGQRLHKSRTLCGTWSGRWQWQLRVRRYDADQIKIRRDADAMAALEFARETEAERIELRRTCLQLAKKCAEKFTQMMGFPVAKTEVVETYEDGRSKVTIVHPGPWRVGDAVRMAHAVQSLGSFGTGITKGLPDPVSGKQDDEDEFDGVTQPPDLPKITIEIRDTTGGQNRVVTEDFATQSPAALTKGENDGPSFKFGRA